jgi:hypothetical protein
MTLSTAQLRTCRFTVANFTTNGILFYCDKRKRKGDVHPRTGPECPEGGGGIYISLLSL